MKNIAFPDFKLFSGNSHRELAEEIEKNSATAKYPFP